MIAGPEVMAQEGTLPHPFANSAARGSHLILRDLPIFADNVGTDIFSTC